MHQQNTQASAVVPSWEEFSAGSGEGRVSAPQSVPVPAVPVPAVAVPEPVTALDRREMKLETSERRKVIETALQANRGQLQSVAPSSGPAATDSDLTAFLLREGVSQASIDHAFNVHSDRLALRDKVAAKLAELGLRAGVSVAEARKHLEKEHPELSNRTFYGEEQLGPAVDIFLKRLPALVDRRVAGLEDALSWGWVPHIDTGISFKISKFKYAEWRHNPVVVGAKLATFPLYAVTRLAISNRPPNLGTPKLETVKSPAFDRLRAEVSRLGLTFKAYHDGDWKFAKVWISFENLIPAK